MEMFLLIVASIIIISIISLKKSKEIQAINDLQKKKILADIASIKGYEVTKAFVCPNSEDAISFDEKRSLFGISRWKGESYVTESYLHKKNFLNKDGLSNETGSRTETTLVSHRDILSAELFEDGTSITKSSRASQLGSALVGGILFGGAGAVVGGLTGSKETSSVINRVELRLVVNNTANPIYDICLLDSPVSKGSEAYNTVSKEARYWLSVVDIFIKRADQEDEMADKNSSSNRHDFTSELTKLAELKTNGLISDEEFSKLKGNILTKIYQDSPN